MLTDLGVFDLCSDGLVHGVGSGLAFPTGRSTGSEASEAWFGADVMFRR